MIRGIHHIAISTPDLDRLADLEPGSVDLAYLDPPFNTGGRQSRTRIATVRDENGDPVLGNPEGDR